MSTMVVGHRGSPDEAPENTLASFDLAVRQGAQMVELDTRLTKDGIPIVIHDGSMTRTSHKTSDLQVAKATLAELQQVDLGDGQRVPTLEETLARLCPHIHVNVELKLDNPHVQPLCEGVAKVIKKLDVVERIFISSFIHRSLHVMKRLLPEIAVGPLLGDWTGPLYPADLDEIMSQPKTEFMPRAAVYDWKMVTPQIVERFHRDGGNVLVYTVNDEKDLKAMLDLKIDAIITNRPGLLCQLIQKAG